MCNKPKYYFFIFPKHTDIAATQQSAPYIYFDGIEKAMLERTIPLPADSKIQGALDDVQRNLYQLL